MKLISKTIAAVAAAGLSVGISAAPPVDLIANGDFESGAFAPWNIVNTGSGGVTLNTGAFVPPGPGGALPPITGNFDAVTFQGGPGFHAIRQTVNVPNNVFSARLSWNDRVRNHAGLFSDPNQEWRALILDPLAIVPSQEVFSTNPGDPLLQVGPNGRAFDVTAIVQGYAGQQMEVSFEEQDNLFFFNATLDDVVLLVSVLPTDMDECKKDGWETFVNVNTGQQIFKNQGDCVSFVATQGKNPPANY